MNDRAAIAWLARRAGFGLAPGELDASSAAGLAATLDRWLDPDSHGVAAAPDPWDGIDLTFDPQTTTRVAVLVIAAWLRAMGTTPRPFEEWMRWFWHGHFVSTVRVVHAPGPLVDQLRLFGRLGLGDFPTLLREVTVDPAMLLYLDGTTNTAKHVNENYGREVLELFSLGIGNYTEADVRAGSTALTGWVGYREQRSSQFLARRHDDTPQSYLGRTGVHDVDSVVDAIVSHKACAPFVAGKLARAILGPGVDQGLVTSLASDFAASGMQIRPLVRAILEAGLEHGASTPLIMAPVPWAVAMMRATGLQVQAAHKVLQRDLQQAGQVPLDAPNVGGWPGGAAWLSSSATLARFDLAGTLATLSPPTSPPRQAAARGDYAALADSLGLPDGFSDPTQVALRSVPSGRSADVSRLTVAMAAPDLVLA